jgi:hypothetical protein
MPPVTNMTTGAPRVGAGGGAGSALEPRAAAASCATSSGTYKSSVLRGEGPYAMLRFTGGTGGARKQL